MPTKTTGLELKKFMNDQFVWKDGRYLEDEEISIDGGEPCSVDEFNAINDSSIVVIHSGVICDEDNNYETLESEFRKWRKRQSTLTLLVEVSSDKVDKVKKAIKDAGGRVV
jgi:hypothetical protein